MSAFGIHNPNGQDVYRCLEKMYDISSWLKAEEREKACKTLTHLDGLFNTRGFLYKTKNNTLTPEKTAKHSFAKSNSNWEEEERESNKVKSVII